MIKNIGYIQKLTSPNPFALITIKKLDDTTNLMALSWWTYVSNHPATIAVCISKKNYSHELLLKYKEFGFNIIDQSLKQTAILCGTCSGRDENKSEKFNIELIEPTKIKTKLVKAHKVALECKMIDLITISDHSMFFGEVLVCHTNPNSKQLYAMDGYSRLDTV